MPHGWTTIVAFLLLAVPLLVHAQDGSQCVPPDGHNTWFVDPAGRKNGTGSLDAPFQAIQAAVERSSSGDIICLLSGDYELNNDIVIAEMAVLHIAAYMPWKRPHLIDWGIQLQATQGMISNFTLTDVIIESSRPLRIIGTVNYVTIARTDFLMLGSASEPVIRFDRVKLGGDGTDPADLFNGIRFVDCVFDTRDSYTHVDAPFFSWKRLNGPASDEAQSSGLIFQNVVMRGGTRGPLLLAFEGVSNVEFKGCQLSQGSLIMPTSPTNWTIAHNTFDSNGIFFSGNATDVRVINNVFQNFGRPKPQPQTPRPSSIHFLPSDDDITVYQDLYLANNTFINFSRTVDNGLFSYAAIDFIGSSDIAIAFNNILIVYNDFSQMSPFVAKNLASAHDLLSSTDMTLAAIPNPFNRTGPWAIATSWSDLFNASLNFFGVDTPPSSCCNPASSFFTPQVSPRIVWSPWCMDLDCNRVKVDVPQCDACSPTRPTAPSGDESGLVVVIVVTATLALIVVIIGITGVYCLLRPKAPNEYQRMMTDGWRSRLLASVPDVQALFDQFGVPLIHFENLILNPIPIGTGSFGSVYDGSLVNADHISLHQELNTLADTDTLSRSFSSNTMDYHTPLPEFIDDHVPQSKKKKTKKGQEQSESTNIFAGFFGSLGLIKDSPDPSPSETVTSGVSSPTGKKKSNKKKNKKDEARPIAVKVLNSAITDTYEDMNEFLEEIKIMASIDHPNLLKLRGVAIDPISENMMLVMDLMDMGSLDDVIFKKKVPMSFARKMAIATEIGYALHYLHSKEPAICHRDLKPGNVLVSRKWTIKVCDFGSSRVLDRKTATMTIKGTPIYLAPESINSSKFSEKSDVYSYGITLVELFGGVRAFDDIEGNTTNLMFRIAIEGLRPTLPRDIPISLKSLLRRCMATDPEERPNFTDILEKLAEVRAASADLSPAQIADLPAPDSAASSAPSSPPGSQ